MKKKREKIIVTGSAGFIGFSVCLKLLKRGEKVVGIDNHNNYYDPSIKEARVQKLLENQHYHHYKIDLIDNNILEEIFQKFKPKKVINLAAQAGVRYSMENPSAYIQSNVVGFMHILENCKKYDIKHLVYASTSSVYGANTKMPFSENDSANHPLSIYAATKKTNELMAHAYSHLYHLPTTGLRFFTVYGPWGRPDMALFKFTRAILEGKAIELFNHGKHSRDFTYIDDIVDGVLKILDNPARSNSKWSSINPDPATSKSPWRLYNIGNNKRVNLMDYVSALEKTLGKKAKIKFLPLQPGDVPDTDADIKNIREKFDYKPSTSVIKGVTKFVEWFNNYYHSEKNK